MCTMSAMQVRDPTRGHAMLRVCFNRDEQRTRATALPPEQQTFEDCRVLMPGDPDSRGTWIAVQDRGLVFCLLNANPHPAPGQRSATPSVSRGRVIPTLLGADNLDEVMRRLRGASWRDVLPFRLVCMNLQHGQTAVWDGSVLGSIGKFDWHAPRMFTSSGLGDDLVREPRMGLFKQLIHPDEREVSPEDQDAFHAHQWPDRPQLSVRMERADACTVSWTVIELTPCQATMSYWTSPSQSDRHRLPLPLIQHASPGTRGRH